MWIFSQYGFYSVVKATEEPGMQLRTREKGHLENLIAAVPALKGRQVKETPDGDYQYRLIISDDEWKNTVLPQLGDIDYTNFKNKAGDVFGHNSKYVNFLHELWSAVYQWFHND